MLSGSFHTLWGRDTVNDSLCGISYELSPQAFYQINPPQAERLYRKAAEYAALTGRETVLDMYCGAGTISLFLAQGAGRVIGAEIIPEAVENARANAVRNGIENAEFICADASEAAEKFLSGGVRPEVIVVDPPRKGMDEAAVRALCGMMPDRMVYVSCNPATLARDITVFEDCGYTLTRAEAFDLFPRTSHVETVVQLVRKKPDTYIDITVDMDELDLTSSEAKATYDEIKDYIFDKHCVKVSSLYIAQVKQKHGIIERDCYNNSKKYNPKQPQCPPEKVKLIEEALRHFKMIS